MGTDWMNLYQHRIGLKIIYLSVNIDKIYKSSQ